ncbi:MAG: ABC transporter permease [Patescibacteria group bacterium]|nr:ABC transporter permease [Patescibacteria group bacterium]
MKIRRIYGLALRQFYLLRATPTRFVQIFAWGALDLILWGFITKYLAATGGGSVVVSTFLGAILLWDFLGRVMQSIDTAFFEDVWSRNFLNMFGSPISPKEYIAGLVAVGILTSTLSFVVMIALATLLFGFSIFSYGIALLPFVLILYLSGVALGILGIAIVLRLGPSAEWFIWPIPAVLAPFVGIFYPLSVLPYWMQAIGQLLPPSYVFEGMRSVIQGHGFSLSALGLGALLALFCIALAYRYFMHVYKRALRDGLIARYSAESVG